MANKILEGELLPPNRQTENQVVTVEGLKANLDNAVQAAFLHGATEWVRLNHPTHYERLLMRFDDSALLGVRRYFN